MANSTHGGNYRNGCLASPTKDEAMKLTVMDRIVLGDILPMQASLLDLVLSKNIRAAVEFTEEELVALKITHSGGIMKWDVDAAEVMACSVEFTGPQTKLIVERLGLLDKQKELTSSHLGLCELFAIGKES